MNFVNLKLLHAIKVDGRHFDLISAKELDGIGLEMKIDLQPNGLHLTVDSKKEGELQFVIPYTQVAMIQLK